MTEQELERALRRALPPLHPRPDLLERICAQIDPSAGQHPEYRAGSGRATAPRAARRAARAGQLWLPAALAATVLTAFGLGLAQWVQQQHHQRQLQVRAQLLQGLTIASASLQDARSAVLQSEASPP